MKKRNFFSPACNWTRYSLPLLMVIPVIFTPAWSSGETALPDETANSVHTIVNGIVSYTRWPQLNGLPRLCILSSATWARELAQPRDKPAYFPVPVENTDQALLARCDAVYFGRESIEQQVQLREKYHGKPQLYIAEQNPECSAGSAFCLNIAGKKVSFSVNLDSLSRGGVRVSPDVLMLARARKNNDE